jgi:hypothetical protein
MLNLFLSFLLATLAALLPWTAFAQEIDLNRVDTITKKYNVKYERPKSCPMESKKFSDLVTKTDAIKDVLKGNCLQKENDKMSEVLESIKSIQDELKNNNIVSSATSATSTASSNDALTDLISSTLGLDLSNNQSSSKSLSGIKFSKLFSNITTMFKKNQCSLEDGSVLEMTADLIYDTTQLGMISGNELGLIVAGGGFLISSALRLIDLIFKQRFDFEKPLDRQTFIKLNCSFYDIRRELDLQGAFDLENNSTREDYKESVELLEKMAKELKKIEDDKVNLEKIYSEMDQRKFSESVADLTDFKKTLARLIKYLQPGLNQSLDIPTETQKLLMISKLAQDYDSIVSQFDRYKKLNLSSIPMLDDLFILELKKFDSMNPVVFQETMNLSAKEFNDLFRAKILFHLIRVQDDISSKEQKLSEENRALKSKLAKELESRKTLLSGKFLELKKVELKLGSIVAPKEFSGLDDGSDNMISILDNHKKISSQLYGEWGDKFLKYASFKSSDEVKNFEERYDLFTKKYDALLAESDLTKAAKKADKNYFCQDAAKLRMVFKHADSIAQGGFDFVATNKDLLYSDVKNYYNGRLNEEDSRGVIGNVERVQRHYKSVIIALKALKGEAPSQEEIDMYLTKPPFGQQYLGKSMLDVATAKKKMISVQEVYEKFNCQKRLGDDLSF